jgi:quinol-cytochrome oxidoreductase complex cytochrome b subunit
MKPSFFTHLHPPTIPTKQSRLRYTLGAGGISVYLILVLFVTGALEMFYYIPTAEEAAQSIQTITYLVPFGDFVRNLHYWAAQALVVTTLVHLLRVVLTGSYSQHRRFNYLLGLGLFVLVVFLDFSGYILRWDADIHWVLVTGTNLLKTIPVIGSTLYRFVLGGEDFSTATVIRFYAWHLFGLSLGLVFFGFWHLFRLRRDGGIAVPPPTSRETRERITREELVRRELMAVLVSSIILVLLAAWFPAPIAPPMDTTSLGQVEHPRAPWFFLWVQGLLRFGDPFWMGVAIPLGMLIFLAVMPYILASPAARELGKWWLRSGRSAQVIVIILLVLIVFFTFQALAI